MKLVLVASVLGGLLLLGIFFFNDTATTEIYTLSLHDALPISNRIMKAMISPNRPVASASAKPSRAGVVIWFCEAGLRAIELTSAAKMLPIPTPAPTRAMQARPAPIILAEARSMVLVLCFFAVLLTWRNGG